MIYKMFNLFALLEDAVSIVGQDPGKEIVEAAGEVAADTAQAAPGLMDSGIMMIAFYALIIGALWFFMMRPQRKREKQMKELQEGIRAGDNVVTSSGFYGKVVSVGDDCFIIEFGTNRGIRVPVRKSDILGIKSPSIGASIPAETPEKA